MKFKLDENFGARTVPIFREVGHDVETVRDEHLSGSPDPTIFDACVREQRCLVTLDLDFADVLRFPPHLTAGIAVIRLPQRTSTATMEGLVRRLLLAVQAGSIAGRLWIVETTRVRIHERTNEED
jgi:predicted nuclease of predicted toxin-antitoxin system